MDIPNRSKIIIKRGKKRFKLSDIAKNYRIDLISRRTKYEWIVRKVLLEMNMKFVEQKIFYYDYSFFIVDFYLPDYRVVLEIDGRHHTEDKEVKSRDKFRTSVLKELGVKRVVRINNQDCKEDFIKNIINNQIKRYDKVCL